MRNIKHIHILNWSKHAEPTWCGGALLTSINPIQTPSKHIYYHIFDWNSTTCSNYIISSLSQLCFSFSVSFHLPFIPFFSVLFSSPPFLRPCPLPLTTIHLNSSGTKPEIRRCFQASRLFQNSINLWTMFIVRTFWWMFFSDFRSLLFRVMTMCIFYVSIWFSSIHHLLYLLEKLEIHIIAYA